MKLTQEAFNKLLTKIQDLETRLAQVEGIRRPPTLTEVDRRIYKNLTTWLRSLSIYDYKAKSNEYWNRFGSFAIAKALKDQMCTNTMNFEKCCKYHKKLYYKNTKS